MKKLFLMFAVCLGTLFATAQTIAPSLTEEMAKRGDDEKIKISIMMQEQADASAMLRTTNAFATNKERREYVVATLKRQAEAAQADLLSLLEEMQRNGMVADIRPLWIANAIGCEANKTAIEALGQRNDIRLIYKSAEVYCNTDPGLDSQPEVVRGIADHITQINAEKAWDLGFTGEGVLVGHLDTGVAYEHLDLQGRLWDGGDEFPNHGYDVFYHDNDPRDYFGHGTKVAGIICGTGAAGTQTGVAPGATVMAVKVFPDDGEHPSTDAVIAEAMQFAVEHGAQVLNMSLGMAGQAEVRRGLYRQAADNILAAGVLIVATAGNERYYIEWGLMSIPYVVGVPGACPSPWPHPDQAVNPGEVSAVLCVGSVDDDKVVTWFSSPGPTTWADSSGYGDYPYIPNSETEIGLIKPDIVAPGAHVVSLKFDEEDGYVTDAGTSFSAPQVAGVVALMLSKDPDLTPAQIDEIIQTTCEKLTERKSNDTGSGFVDALAAVMAVGGTTQTYSINATVNPTEGGTITGTGTYIEGQQVTLSVETFTDYVFENWTENDEVVSTEPVYTFTASANRNLVANLLYTEGVAELGSTANVYPNPSTEGFTVVCEGMTEATVYSMDGKLVKRIVAAGQCNIDGLSEGVYLLKINTVNGTLVQKIVKM